MLSTIKSILVEEGYEVFDGNDDAGIFKVKDLDCGLVITAVLENNILFFSVPCKTVKNSEISLDLAMLLLNAENGISTSSFQVYDRKNGTSTITLNNFCKLLDMGEEDNDDILSCINFLSIDVFAAKELLNINS